MPRLTDSPSAEAPPEPASDRQDAESRIRFQAMLLDAVEQAVVARDLAGRVVYWNRFAERLYGWTAAEAMGRTLQDLIVPEPLRPTTAEITTQLQGGQAGRASFWRTAGTAASSRSLSPIRPSVTSAVR